MKSATVDNAPEPSAPDYRISVRIPRAHADILEGIIAERRRADPDAGRIVLSTLVREALEAYFHLPCVDTKIDATLTSVSP